MCQTLIEIDAPFLNNYSIMPEFLNPGGYEAVTEYYGVGEKQYPWRRTKQYKIWSG